MKGDAGDDTILGFGGNDTLIGGNGNDVFQILTGSSSTGTVTIQDAAAEDMLRVFVVSTQKLDVQETIVNVVEYFRIEFS